jgi:hypothetical protein
MDLPARSIYLLPLHGAMFGFASARGVVNNAARSIVMDF